MANAHDVRLPSDPQHPDHEMYKHLLTGIQGLHRWNPEQCNNLAAALYAEVRDRQPHINERDIGQILAGDPAAAHPSLFALPRVGYHHHNPDPAALRFSVPITSASLPAAESLNAFARPVRVGADGFLLDTQIVHNPVSQIQHGPLGSVNAIVLHRTESSSASGTLEAWRTGAGIGAHFLIDKDGTTYQTMGVDQKAWHVGPIRSRGEVEETIDADDRHELQIARAGQSEWRGSAVKAVSHIEATRPYPERYPTNDDSIGIEVVGRYDPGTKRWEAPTPEQTASVRRLVVNLQQDFGLNDNDVYQHDVISRKTPGEGAGLFTPTESVAPAADAVGMPGLGPRR